MSPEPPRRIPVERYRSAEWHGRELRLLWPRVWQIACSADCVPGAGDCYEYRVGHLSALIVRGKDGRIRAFQNACRHRGNQLVSGSACGLSEIRCSYHGWCYDLHGHLRSVSSDGPARARPGALGLVPVQAECFGGLVFVNFDPAAEPLASFLETLPQELAWVRMGDYSCRHAFSVPLRCNWKVVVDAFIETYHLHVVHPQMLRVADDIHTPIRLLGRHSMFEQPYGMASPRLAAGVAPQEMWEAFVRDLGHRMGLAFAAGQSAGPHPPIPPGGSLRDALVAKIREHLRSLGDPYPDLSDDQVINDYHYHFFPNSVFNVFAGWYGLIRARPGDGPDRCWLDMWNFDLLPKGHPEEHCRPREVVLQPEEVGPLGLVVSQDVSLLPRIQQGLSQPGLRELRLVGAEARIGLLHQGLDRYLGTSLEAELRAQDAQENAC